MPGGCEAVLKLENLRAHSSKCLHQAVRCLGAEDGCQALMPRSEILKHAVTCQYKVTCKCGEAVKMCGAGQHRRVCGTSFVSRLELEVVTEQQKISLESYN